MEGRPRALRSTMIAPNAAAGTNPPRPRVPRLERFSRHRPDREPTSRRATARALRKPCAWPPQQNNSGHLAARGLERCDALALGRDQLGAALFFAVPPGLIERARLGDVRCHLVGHGGKPQGAALRA